MHGKVDIMKQTGRWCVHVFHRHVKVCVIYTIAVVYVVGTFNGVSIREVDSVDKLETIRTENALLRLI